MSQSAARRSFVSFRPLSGASLRRVGWVWASCVVLSALSAASPARAEGQAKAPIAAAKSATRVVTLHDHGLNMPRGTVEVPSGWRVDSQQATSPQTGHPVAVKCDYRGPHGELIRTVPQVKYSAEAGMPLAMVAEQHLRMLLSDVLTDVQFGQPRQVQAPPSTMPMQAYQVPFVGSAQGKPFAGNIELEAVSVPSMPGTGEVYGNLVLSPQASLQQTLTTARRILQSYRENPTFRGTYLALMQAHGDAERAAIMANAHREVARINSAPRSTTSSDSAHKRFIESIHGGGASESSSDYDSHDAYVDGIHDRQTFYDAGSGQNVSQAGAYDYNYTDNLGNYYRTNDPSFDPAALPGNWSATQPLTAQ